MKRINKTILICLCALFCLSPFSINPSRAAGCDTTSDMMLVSVKTGGAPVSDVGTNSDISDDARYIIFSARDGSIVPNDTNNAVDLFLHDRQTCTTTLVSRTPSGNPGAGDQFHGFPPFISGNGQYVLFSSERDDLVSAANDGFVDVFLYDHSDQSVILISKGMSGAEANGHSYPNGISADGRFVVFLSYASNLVLNDTNNVSDVFLLDRQSNTIERISVNSDEEQGNGMSWYGDFSSDGRYMAFISTSTNFSTLDTTNQQKAFLRDIQEGTTTLVSVNSNGEPADRFTPGVIISGNSRFIGLVTEATNFDDGDTNGQHDGYVHNLLTGETTWVTPRSDDSYAYVWSLSADGRYAATELPGSLSADDANDQSDIYLFDMQTGISTLQSHTPSGQAGNDYSISPMLTPDAQYVLFMSNATDLIAYPPSTGRNLYLARVTLPSGSLNVEVGLQGRPAAPHPAWVTSVRVVIVPQGSTTPVYDEILMTDDNGSLAIPELNYGIYTVWVKGANTLAVSQSITLAADSLPVSVELLPAGDANGDNVVSLADFSILASSFGTQLSDAGYDARADFNGDNLVTLPDFSLLASNFSTIGDALPG